MGTEDATTGERCCLAYATWDRGHLLERSLRRVAELTVPDEIVVVDDGSSDDTAAACERARDELGLPLRRLYNHRPYEAMCSQAKNCAVRATDAELMIFSEPEMYFETDVVAQLLAQHAADWEWGTRRLLNVGTVRHEQAPGTTCGCGCGSSHHVTRNFQAFWVTLFRREWLEEVGGWDEHFPQNWGVDDVDAGTRLRISHVGQHNLMDAVATHQWHPPRANVQAPNWAYFEAKGFNGNESLDHPHRVANGGREWGRLVEA